VDEVRTRIDSRFAAMARGVHAYWCVVPTGSEEAAGFVAAHNLDRPRDVVLSYAIAVEHRGRGYLTRALPAVVGHLFEDRDVLEIRATTHPDNLASVLALRRAGFGLETRIRQHDGWYEDLVGDDALRFVCWSPDKSTWRLREHEVTLTTQRLTLRLVIEADWPALLRCNDPDVLYFWEGDHVESCSLEDLQRICLGVSRSAFCFITEYESEPVGECWVQDMNLDRIWQHFRGQDCRRLDLAIGEKRLWGQGLGSEAIAALVELAFQQQGVERLFGIEVADYNPRSRRAFERNGFRVVDELRQHPGSKAAVVYDLRLDRSSMGPVIGCG